MSSYKKGALPVVLLRVRLSLKFQMLVVDVRVLC